MGYKVGSGEWFDHVTTALNPWLGGVEVYKGGTTLGRIPRENEQDGWYISFLVTTPPIKEFDELQYESCTVRNEENGIYELRFRMKYNPELRYWLNTARNLGLTPPEGVEWTEEFFCLNKPGGPSVFVFE